MPLRRRLLNLLSDGEFHSGEALGASLGVSRMAVWKHLKALREMGVDFTVVRGKGYCLPSSLELLDRDRILAAATYTSTAGIDSIEVFLEVDSTNNWLREQALNGAPSGTVCVAETQLAGRGRRGRTWVSPSCGIEGAGLKWPNDILVGDAKLAGVLIDVVGESSGPCIVIVGIGVNVCMPPGEAAAIDQLWTDLHHLSGDNRLSRNLLAARILDELVPAIETFDAEGLPPFLDEWWQSDVLRGRKVGLTLPNEYITGTASGIDDVGALLVDTGNGRRRFLSGDVSVRVAS